MTDNENMLHADVETRERGDQLGIGRGWRSEVTEEQGTARGKRSQNAAVIVVFRYAYVYRSLQSMN